MRVCGDVTGDAACRLAMRLSSPRWFVMSSIMVLSHVETVMQI